MAAVINGSMSQRKAVAFYNVPRTTLQDRLRSGSVVKPKLGRKPLLSMDDETKLVDYACNRDELGIGFGTREFLRYAGDLAKKTPSCIQMRHALSEVVEVGEKETRAVNTP